MATEQPYGQVSKVLELILGVSQHVDSLERMSRGMSASAEEFCWSQAAPPTAEEGEILVESADGKGVPIRHAADAPPIRAHEHRCGPSPIASGWRRWSRCIRWIVSYGRPSKCWRRCFTTRRRRSRTICRNVRGRSTSGLTRDWTAIPSCPTINRSTERRRSVGWSSKFARLATRNQPVEVVCVMDGQPSLWELRERFQSDLPTVQILDLLHGTSRLWKAAHLFHPGGHLLE